MSFPDAKVIHSNWDQELRALVGSSKSQILVINPFLQPETIKRLFAKFRGPIRVLTRFNLNDFYCGVSSLDALDRLLSRRAEIRGVKRLHAKVFTFDAACALVCSANLTDAALMRNVEFGVITSSASTVKAIKEEFERIWNKAGPSLTKHQIATWRKEVQDARDLTPAPRIKALRDCGATVSSGGMVSSAEAVANQETKFNLEDAENFFCKFSAKSEERPKGNLAVRTWIEDCEFVIGGYYPRGKRPRQIQDGDVMFPAVLCKEPHATFIIGRAYAFKHVEGVDEATTAEWNVRYKEWKKEWPYRTRFRDGEYLDGKLSDGIRLSTVMERFKTDAFVTSQIAALEDPNFKPQKSVRQQAYVRLTYAAAQWVNAELDLIFAKTKVIRPNP